MSRKNTRFVCQQCGAVASKWAGRCEVCEAWNSMVEEAVPPTPLAGGKSRNPTGAAPSKLTFVPLAGESAPPPRTETSIAELDRVLGGGLVPGSVVLVGGDPGIGKSTLLLQAAAALSRDPKLPERVLYVSGEEAIDQLRMRARRLGLEAPGLGLAASIDVREIIASVEATRGAQLVVIDSIQTMWLDGVDSAPGSVSQVRAAGFELIRSAKARGFALILVGHVTKEGAIAGPRVLEHMVDAVLYFEGDRGHQFRILRAAKNRFGATDEIGVFEMTDRGLAEVPNPSALFLAERRGNIAGSAVFAGMEGTRPVLLEVQVLLSNNNGSSPRRAVVGWDGGRLNMLLAVLETRCGLKFANTDVHLNIAGGLRVSEPAADLAVAAALVSAATDTPNSAGSVFFGEVGLSGEVRQVSHGEARLREAQKLGFEQAFHPRMVARGNRKFTAPAGLRLEEIGHLSDLVGRFTHPGGQKAKETT